MSIRLPRLGASAQAPFPDPEGALDYPNGLLAIGGDLSVPRLLNAYREGIFPWFSEGEPLLWWSPDPRCVFDTQAMHVPRRLARWLRRSDWQLGCDGDFERVIDSCAAPREAQGGTWITAGMRTAYLALHAAGHAHSIEARAADGRLVGGLYGVAVGRMFFAESMFSLESNGSKAALLGLAALLSAWGWPLIDAQMPSAHLATLGAQAIGRREFLQRVRALVQDEPGPLAWRPSASPLPLRELLRQRVLA